MIQSDNAIELYCQVWEGKLKDGRTCAVKQVDHVQVWDYYSPASIYLTAQKITQVH